MSTGSPAADLPAAAGHEGRGYAGWRVVATLAVTETVCWGVLFYTFGVVLLPMQAGLDAGPGAVSGAFSVGLLVMGVAAVPVGRWVDRHGGRAVMTTGSLLGALAVLAWSQVRDVTQLYAVFVLVGLAAAMVLYEPAFAVVVQWFDRRRSSALLLVTVAAGFASTIFVPLAAYLEGRWGWRAALLVLAVVVAATAVPHALVLRPGPWRDDGVHTRTGLGATARALVRDRHFAWLSLGIALNYLALGVAGVHLYPFLVESGHPSSTAALAVGALGVLSVAGRVLLTGLVARWPMALVAAAMFLAQGAGVGVLLVAPGSGVAVVVFVLLFGLGFGVGTLARPALVAEAYGVRAFATVSALLGLAVTAAKVLGPAAVGVVRGLTGGYLLPWAGVGACCLVAAVALVAAQRAPVTPTAAAPGRRGTPAARRRGP